MPHAPRVGAIGSARAVTADVRRPIAAAALIAIVGDDEAASVGEVAGVDRSRRVHSVVSVAPSSSRSMRAGSPGTSSRDERARPGRSAARSARRRRRRRARPTRDACRTREPRAADERARRERVVGRGQRQLGAGVRDAVAGVGRASAPRSRRRRRCAVTAPMSGRRATAGYSHAVRRSASAPAEHEHAAVGEPDQRRCR